ncbi:DUF4345 domain-containing protein [Haliscomenobacter sp.]|uniref:DUF4345 domain-containing protein n=1 Tax=Haliscomenobacter sp. TaxID=2717303 RepID=UPI003BAC1F7A
MPNPIIQIRNLHLGIASLTIILVGLSYGLCPSQVLPFLFDFKVESVDLSHVFRAMMGLYLGFATYWIIGIFKEEHWRGATLSSIVFMGGLASGRMLSILVDGIPSVLFLIGTIIEILFMLWGLNNLKTESKTTNHELRVQQKINKPMGYRS